MNPNPVAENNSISDSMVLRPQARPKSTFRTERGGCHCAGLGDQHSQPVPHLNTRHCQVFSKAWMKKASKPGGFAACDFESEVGARFLTGMHTSLSRECDLAHTYDARPPPHPPSETKYRHSSDQNRVNTGPAPPLNKNKSEAQMITTGCTLDGCGEPARVSWLLEA